MSWSDPTGASTQIGATDDPDAFTGTTGNDLSLIHISQGIVR